MEFWALLGIVLGILVIVGLVSFWLEKRRTEAMRQVASGLNLSFKPSDKDKEVRAKYSAFRLFDKGHSRKVFNIMEGKADDMSIRMFDYEYVIGRGGRRSTVWQQTIIHFTSEKLQAPLFYMRPEGLMERIGTTVMGTQDIDFDSNPKFSSAYQLQSAYEREVREFFNEKRLNFFAENKSWFIETRNHEVIIYQEGYRSSTNDTPLYFKQAMNVFNVLV